MINRSYLSWFASLLRACITSLSSGKWKMVTQGAHAERYFSDEGWGEIGSFPLIQSFGVFFFFHSRIEIKLLETSCNFYSHLGTVKRHFILRSGNKTFQLVTMSVEHRHLSIFPRACLFVVQPRLLLNKDSSVCSFRSHSNSFSSCRAAWNLV